MTEAVLAQRVSADTITQITSSPVFTGPAKILPQPTVQDLIDKVRKNLKNSIERARAGLAEPENPGEKKPDYAKYLARALQKQSQFENMMQNPPEGFRYVPVYYSKIDGDSDGTKIRNEYSFKVRPQFLKYIADNHSDALKKMGICDYGINRMKNGLDPADAQGRFYEVNVDHIVERSGSGKWGIGVEADTDQHNKSSRYRVNHFANLMLMPEHVHEQKNILNNIQQIGNLKTGEGTWILMMVPERNAQFCGFVCPPQKPGHQLYGMRFRPEDINRDISNAYGITKMASENLRRYNSNPLLADTIKTFDEISAQKNTTIADIANDNSTSLRQTFNDVISRDARVRGYTEDSLKPAIRETTASIKKVFDKIAASKGGQHYNRDIEAFSRFYNGKTVQKMRAEAVRLPIEETVELQKLFREIDAKLPPRSGNENNSPPARPRDNNKGQRRGGWEDRNRRPK